MSRDRSKRNAVRATRLHEARTLLGSVCVKCGAKDNLQFDHVDPKTKLFDIVKGADKPIEIFWLEVAKCQLLCVPHHAEKCSMEQAGELQLNSKLTEQDVKRIRELASQGIVQKRIADEFGITAMNVSLIVRRKRWKHV